jgi:hypothetical protein
MSSGRRNIYYIALLLLVSFVTACKQRVAGALLSNAPTSINEQWTSIALSQPAVAKWDVQLIYLTVRPEFRPSFAPLGMQLEDGSVIVPEVELISGSGQGQRFRLAGLINGEQLVFRNDQIARKSTFSEVRIRSSKPIVCSQINWMSYMPQDTKNGIP